MSYCVTSVMDTPFLPAGGKHQCMSGVYVRCEEDDLRRDKKKKKKTCSGCSPDSVDVDLGKAGGVVINDNLDSWDIQTPVGGK